MNAAVTSGLNSRLTVPLLAVLVSVVCAMPALAGSGAAPVVEPPVIAPEPLTLDLNGFYGGGNVAYAFGEDDSVGHRAPDGSLVSTVGTLEPGGFNYGLRVGWRNTVPVGRVSYVYGFELGYDAGGVEDSVSTATQQASVDIRNTISFRFKSGVTNIPGNMHFYGIVGYARGDIDYSVSGPAGGDTIAIDDSSDYDGYMLGVGVERALRENLSVTLEYEFTHFDSKTLRDAGGSSTEATPEFGNLRLGLNFAF